MKMRKDQSVHILKGFAQFFHVVKQRGGMLFSFVETDIQQNDFVVRLNPVGNAVFRFQGVADALGVN